MKESLFGYIFRIKISENQLYQRDLLSPSDYQIMTSVELTKLSLQLGPCSGKKRTLKCWIRYVWQNLEASWYPGPLPVTELPTPLETTFLCPCPRELPYNNKPMSLLIYPLYLYPQPLLFSKHVIKLDPSTL